jgi:hypothetical protein
MGVTEATHASKCNQVCSQRVCMRTHNLAAGAGAQTSSWLHQYWWPSSHCKCSSEYSPVPTLT